MVSEFDGIISLGFWRKISLSSAKFRAPFEVCLDELCPFASNEHCCSGMFFSSMSSMNFWGWLEMTYKASHEINRIQNGKAKIAGDKTGKTLQPQCRIILMNFIFELKLWKEQQFCLIKYFDMDAKRPPFSDILSSSLHLHLWLPNY